MSSADPAQLTLASKNRTLRAQVLETLREALAAGVLKPGDKLNEAALAGQMEISRGTVREALRALEQEGLLVSIPHRGTFVRKLTAAEIVDVYQVRTALESQAARVAGASRRGREQIRRSYELLEQAHASGGSERERLQADIDFHEAICVASGNQLLLRLWRSLIGQITASMLAAGVDNLRELQGPESHRGLLTAIESGDAGHITATFGCHFADSARFVAQVAAASEQR